MKIQSVTSHPIGVDHAHEVRGSSFASELRSGPERVDASTGLGAGEGNRVDADTIRSNNGASGGAGSDVRGTGEGAGRQTYDALKSLAGGRAAADAMNRTPSGVPLAYAGKPGGPLRADPATPGVHRADSGLAYIRQGGQTFAVKYDADNGTWRAYTPDNPAKYAYPIKQDESGNWRVHSDVGVPGGFRGTSAAGGSWGQHAVTQLEQQVQQLQNQRQQLQQQRQNLQSQLQQFPGSQHSNRSPAELAQLQGMLQSQLGNVNNQLQAVEQQIQQTSQQLMQLQNELQH